MTNAQSFAPPPKVVVAQEIFPKYVTSLENLVSIIDSYTYNSLSNKVGWSILKKVKVAENMEAKIIQQKVLIENTYVDLMATMMINWELL